MKKISMLLAIILSLSCITLFACNKNSDDSIVNVYMPDGAPALVFAKPMYEENNLGKQASYHVVSSSVISQYVLNKEADIALLPINVAAKLAGDGDTYKLVTVNTHGNLYLLSKLDIKSLNDIKGKTIGIVNINNVPGLTFKAMLKTNSIDYTENLEEKNSNNVLLLGIESGEVAARLNITNNDSACDLVLAPDPQVSKITSSTSIKNVLSLQTLWGNNSYPQAVMIVKKELCTSSFIDNLISILQDNETWILTNQDKVVDTISSHCVSGYQTTLSVGVLTESAILGCNIHTTKAINLKDTIKDYLDKIIDIQSMSTKQVKDEFFYE